MTRRSYAIAWQEKGKSIMQGPAYDGWAIIVTLYQGSPCYKNISFCPFCGSPLPENPESAIPVK